MKQPGQQQRQVGIWVLQATAMPSVLVETGYITNKEEEDYLNSEKGQEEMTQAIVNAIISFKNLLDGTRGGSDTAGPETTSQQKKK